jgi:hypothetical protein
MTLFRKSGLTFAAERSLTFDNPATYLALIPNPTGD